MNGTHNHYYRNLHRALGELKVFKDISNLVTQSLELDDLLNNSVTTISKWMKTDICSVYLKEDNDILQLAATIGLDQQAVKHFKLRVGEGIIGYTAESGIPVNTPRSDENPRYVYCPATGEQSYYSMLAVPLKQSNLVVGVLCVQTYERRDYSPDEVEFLLMLASQISGAIQNAVLYQKQNQSLQEISRLYEIAQSLNHSLDLSAVLKEVAKYSGEIVSGSFACLRLYKPDPKNPIQYTWGESDKAKEWISGSTGQEIYERIRQNQIGLRLDFTGQESSDLSGPEEILSLLALPIILKGEVSGIIAIFNKNDAVNSIPQGFTVDDERILGIVANLAAAAIQNALYYETIRANEHQLVDMREQLIRAERLVAVGELASRIAHEIRNPLVSIGGFARKALQAFPEGNEGRKYLEIVNNEVLRLEEILHEILDFSSPSPPQYKVIDIHQLLEESLQLIQEQANLKKITITTQYDAENTILKVDTRQMKQALINVLLNGVEAITGNDGEIKIHTYMAFPEVGKAERVVVTVRDNGMGISEEDQRHIFEPFFSTKTRGSGLGLSITHKILTDHQATIQLVSRVKSGTMVIIEIPVLYQKQVIKK